MPNVRTDRLILALTDDELEAFVREWAGYKKEYVEGPALYRPRRYGSRRRRLCDEPTARWPMA
jgi:hypothetical protein